MKAKEKDETRFVSEKQVAKLYSRMLKAEESGARPSLIVDVIDAIRDGAKESKGNFRTLVVGAGGSYPVAEYYKMIIEKHKIGMCDAVTPQTALRNMNKIEYDFLIIISYSGRTADDLEVYRYFRIQSGDVYRKVAIITGENPKLVKDYFNPGDVNLKVVSYYSEADETGKEEGMISLFRTIEPCFLAYNGVYEEHKEEIYRMTTKMFNRCNDVLSNLVDTKSNPIKKKTSYTIHVIYEPELYPAAVDLETKLLESGIAYCMIHEAKNFSHGRYTMLYTQDFDIVINLAVKDKHDKRTTFEENELVPFLKEICEEKEKYYLSLSSKEDYLYGNLEMMFFNACFIVRLGSYMDIDVSWTFKSVEGGYPPKLRELYYFRGEF